MKEEEERKSMLTKKERREKEDRKSVLNIVLNKINLVYCPFNGRIGDMTFMDGKETQFCRTCQTEVRVRLFLPIISISRNF